MINLTKGLQLNNGKCLIKTEISRKHVKPEKAFHWSEQVFQTKIMYSFKGVLYKKLWLSLSQTVVKWSLGHELSVFYLMLTMAGSF